jgi:hypothetical protein
MAAGSSELRTHVGIPNCSKNSFNLNEKHYTLFPNRCNSDMINTIHIMTMSYYKVHLKV